MSKLLLSARIETLKSSLADVSSAVDTVQGYKQEVTQMQASIQDASETLRKINTQVKHMRVSFDEAEEPHDADLYLKKIEDADLLQLASKQIEAVKEKLEEMSGRSYSGLEGESAPSRETLDDSIQKTARTVAKQLEELEGALSANNDSKAWATALKDMTRDIPELYNDYVDLLRGLALRDVGLDHGICAIVDELMKGVDKGKMSRWRSLTVPSLEQKISVRMARIIRLGFGDWSLWSVPLAAAQYGQLLSREPAFDAIFTESKKAKSESKKAEIGSPYRTLVADAFATYAMGPAYAASAIVLKLDPSKPGESDINCDPERAVVILDMLGRLDKKKDGAYEPYQVLLSDAWQEALTQNDNNKPVSKGRKKVLVSFTGAMFDYIKGQSANPIAYDEDWHNPVSAWPDNLLEWHERWLAQENASEADDDDADGQAHEQLKDPHELIDVGSLDSDQRDSRHALNVAWMCRLKHPDDVNAIERAVKALLPLIAEVPAHDEPPRVHDELPSTRRNVERFAGSAKQA